MLLGVFRAILLEELLPLLFLGSTLRSVLVVKVIDLLRDDEALLRVKAEKLLDALAIVSLQWVSVHTTSSLELGAKANCGGDLDDGRLVGDLLGLLDGLLNALEVMVAIRNMLDVPSVGLKSLHNVFGERNRGIAIYTLVSGCTLNRPCFLLTNGDLVVIVQADEVAQLEMAGHRSSLAGNALHSTAITENAVGVVVDQVIAGLVENGSGMRLGNGEADSVAETLAQGTGSDLNSWGVMGFRVTWCDAVHLLRKRLANNHSKSGVHNLL